MPKPELPDIPVDADYVLRPQTPEEKAKWEGAEIPEYRIKLDLTPEQKDRLMAQIKMEFEALKQERVTLGLEKKWEDRERQYDGDLAPVKCIEFAIDVRESKIKVDNIVRAMKEAFLPEDGDYVDVSPRPESAANNGWEVAGKQQQFIDYSMDEDIKPEMALDKCFTCAVKKFVGIIKQVWDYKTDIRRREEHWDGKLTPVAVRADGTVIYDNDGLRRFLQAYPDAPKRYPWAVQKLMKGESVDIVVNYRECISNSPKYRYINLKDFYVRNSCEYNEGLRTEHLIGERQQYSYWELKKKESAGEFENVEALFNSKQDDTGEKGQGDFMTLNYDVMELTTYFKINDSDEEETKIKVWMGEEREVFLGAEQYPYYSIDCDYTGFWPKINDKGFYGNAESIMFDLQDTHLAQDALISLLLHSIYIRNTITPIVREGSLAEENFLDHDFENGKPIPVDDLTDDVEKAFSFIKWPTMELSSGLVMLEKLKRIGSDVSRVSDLVTGGESDLDPSAPAAKTIAMLQQSGIGIRDYIKSILPSFNITATNLLQMYYQMSTEDRKYRIRTKSQMVTGKDMFADIKREEMILKTNVQSRAATFVFDKMNEKREGLAAYQIIMANPYLSRMPQVQYKAIKILLSTFGGRWRTLADADLLSPEDFKSQQMRVAQQAIQALFLKAKQQAAVTGVEPDPEAIMAQIPDAITQAQAVDYRPELAGEPKK